MRLRPLRRDIRGFSSCSSPSEAKRTASISFHKRQGNNKSLPLSSFLDPVRLAQRHRNRLSKPKPSRYEDLDTFRKRFADNPYAQLLAQPTRRCEISLARLPGSLILRLKAVKTNPTELATLLPLQLAQDARNPNAAADPLIPLGTSLGAGRSCVLRAPILAKQTKAKTQVKGLARHGYGARTVKAVSHLLRQSIVRALKWPLKRRPQSFVVLEKGLSDVHAVPDVACVLCLEGRVRTAELANLEARVEESAVTINNLLLFHFSSIRNSPYSHRLMPAHPRSRFDLLRLSTINYQDLSQSDSLPTNYTVPILPLIDILGNKQVDNLFEGTKYDKAEWIAIKFNRHTVSPIALLIKSAFWFAEIFPDAEEEN